MATISPGIAAQAAKIDRGSVGEKVRVHTIAKQLGIRATDFLGVLADHGIEGKKTASSLTQAQVFSVLDALSSTDKPAQADKKAAKKQAEKPAKKTAKKATKKAAKKTSKRQTKKAAEQPAEEVSDKETATTVEQPAEQLAEQPAEMPEDKAGRSPLSGLQAHREADDEARGEEDRQERGA